MHHRGTFSETDLQPDPAFAGRSEGYSRATLVGGAVGSPHQRVSVAKLTSGGSVERHFHSYEEIVYVLDGELDLSIGSDIRKLTRDSFALLQSGVAHALRAGSGDVRWLEVAAPQPKPAGSDFPDTFFDTDGGVEVDASAFVGQFDESQLPALALAGFTAANVSGAKLKMLVDPPFGAAHANFFVVQYEEGGLIKEHDHAFEEAYFILAGELEGVAEGETCTLRAGDYFWTSAGCPHAFTNRSSTPARWLETQVPQPPSRQAARFKADWPTDSNQ